MYCQFASSTKYLRQSSWPYIAAFPTQSLFTSSDIFLSSTKYFKMSMRPPYAACLSCRFFFRLSRRFHFVEKKSKTVEVSFNSSLFTRLFFITRAIIREAVLQHLEITFTCCHINRPIHPTRNCFTSLAHLRNSSLFVPATCRKTRLDLSLFLWYLSFPRDLDSTLSFHSNVEMDEHSQTCFTVLISIRLPRRTQAHPDSLYSPLKRKTDLS